MEVNPVEEAEAGTAEEAAEDAAAESIDTDEAGADSATDDDAEGEDSAAGASTPSDVKYSRFRNVNERRKAAESEVLNLRAKLEALQPKKEEPAPRTVADRLKGTLTPAPSDLSVLKQMEYYGLATLEQHADEVIGDWFKKKFGMGVDEAGATLSHAKVSTRESIRSQYEQAAKAHGLDPSNENVQFIVGTAMDTGRFKTFAEAMDAMTPARPTKTVVRSINGKGAETESVDITGLSRVKSLPRTKEEAMKLAASGKRIEAMSVVDILKGMAAKT